MGYSRSESGYWNLLVEHDGLFKESSAVAL